MKLMPGIDLLIIRVKGDQEKTNPPIHTKASLDTKPLQKETKPRKPPQSLLCICSLHNIHHYTLKYIYTHTHREGNFVHARLTGLIFLSYFTLLTSVRIQQQRQNKNSLHLHSWCETSCFKYENNTGALNLGNSLEKNPISAC